MKLADRYGGMLDSPTPTSVLALLGITPVIIAYLAHVPDTKPLRLGAWLLGLTAYVWTVLTIEISPVMNLRVLAGSSPFVLGFNTHWAFTDSTAQFHPLPRSSMWPSLRASRLFRVFHLLCHASRPINIVGLSPPLRRLPGSGAWPWVAAVYHLFWAGIGAFMLDLAGYLPWRLAPDTFGSTDYVGGDFPAWLNELSATHGVPVLVLRVVLSAGLAAEVHFSMTMIYHLLAAVGIASGVFVPEEWPDVFRWPIAATSLSELWGARWHQQNRLCYTTLSRPFASLPRALYILAIFTISALYHIIIYYAREHIVIAYPYLLFYLANGLACLAERQFRHVTGRRVRGVYGWIWTWSFLFLVGQPTVDSEFSTGWAGCLRDVFSKEPDKSMVVWLVHALGWGPSPAEILAAGAGRA